MPFTFNAAKVDIRDGEFVDIARDMNTHDYSTHVHHENSHNTTSTTTTDSHNSSSSKEAPGRVFIDGRHVTLNNDTQSGEALPDSTPHTQQTMSESTSPELDASQNPEGLLESTSPESNQPLMLQETSESQTSVAFTSSPGWRSNNPFSAILSKSQSEFLMRDEHGNSPASYVRQDGPGSDGNDKMVVDDQR